MIKPETPTAHSCPYAYGKILCVEVGSAGFYCCRCKRKLLDSQVNERNKRK